MTDDVLRIQQADGWLAELGPRPFHVPVGRLAPVVVGAWKAMDDQDWVFAGPRERLGALLRGAPLDALADTAATLADWHLGPTSASPGARALHAVGAARASGRPALCFLGLASAASGALHEALNAAAITEAPAIFLLLRQRVDEGAPVGPQLAFEPAALAEAFGIAFSEVAGQADLVRDAVASARAAGRPALIQVLI